MESKYEFHAPQFVDFDNLDQEDQGADSFFDVDMETGTHISEAFSSKVTIPDDNEPENDEEVPPPQPDTEKTKPKKPKNMVTSWEGLGTSGRTAAVGKTGNGKVTPAGPPSLPPRRPAIVIQAAGKPERPARSLSQKSGREEASGADGADSALGRGRQDTPSRRSLRKAVTETIENIRNSPYGLKQKRLGTNHQEPRLGKSQVHNYKATINKRMSRSVSPGRRAAIPRTPDVLKRFKSKMTAVSNLTTQVAPEDFKMKKNSVVKKDNLPMKASSAVVLTKPQEFNFATNSRVKDTKKRSSSASSDAPDFTRMLRSYNKSSEKEPSVHNRGITQPVPFPRAEMSRKRRHSADTTAAGNSTKFLSVAEQLSKFQHGTPDRFRSKPRQASRSPTRRTRGHSASPNPRGRLTVPKTPQLTTKGRSRPHHVISQAEREELELEEARKQQFKAHGVGETVPKMKPGAPVERRPCTIPEPFNLATFTKPLPPPQEKVETFHAQPVNKRILEAPQGIPQKKMIPVVEPESPAFALKQRMINRRPAPEPEPEPEPEVKVRSSSHRGVPVALPPPAKRATVPAPFSFSERDTMTIAKKEERIKKLREEEKAAREFHANPIPRGLEQPRLPEKKVMPLTKPEPFRLNIEERVESRITKWQEDIAKELEDQKKATAFKASEPVVLSKAPFVPKPSDKPLAEISNFTLHSDRRAEERQQYEMERRRKEVDLEEAKRQGEERRRREELEEVARLRREAVHKAQPIRSYKPIEVKPSDKPLTFPSSPRFSTRLKNSSMSSNTTSSSQ